MSHADCPPCYSDNQLYCGAGMFNHHHHSDGNVYHAPSGDESAAAKILKRLRRSVKETSE